MHGVEEDERKLDCRYWWADAQVAGDICLMRPRPTQNCTADDNEDDDYDDDDIQQRVLVNFLIRQKAGNILTS